MRFRLLPPLAVLLVVVAAFVVVTVARPARELTLVFDEVLGLVEGAEVHAGGVRVGEVEEIRLGRDGFPRVQVELDNDLDLRRGGRARLSAFSAAALERRYIALERGSGPSLRDAAVLGREATEGPVEVDAALSTLDPGTRRDVRLLLGRADMTLRERGPALDRTLAHSAEALGEAANLIGDVTRDGQALRTVVTDGRRVSAPLAARREALGEAVEGLGTTLATTADREREVAATLDRLPSTLRSTRSALARVEGATPELSALVRAARPGARELVPTARVLRPTLEATRPALAEGRRLVASAPNDIRPIDALLAEVRPLLPLTRSVLDRGNPMLDQGRVRTPDITGFVTGWADAMSNFDANGHALRSAGVFAEPPRNRIGPSEAEGGRLVRPFTRTPGVLEDEPWRNFRDSFVGGDGR